MSDGGGGCRNTALVLHFLKPGVVLRVKERVKKMSGQMKHDEERRKSLQVSARTEL